MNHVPHDLLLAFAEGDLDEALASHIAEHIDGCGTCLARATALEPLADVLAGIPDPTPPAGLVEAILTAASESTLRPPRSEGEERPGTASTLTLRRPRPVAEDRLGGTPVAARAPGAEIAIGLAMLLVAAALSVAADPAVRELAADPAGAISHAGALLEGVRSMGHTVRVSLGAGPLGIAMAAGMALFGLYLTVRVALGAAEEPLLEMTESGGAP